MFGTPRLETGNLKLETSFQVGNVEIGGGELFLIAGPCVIESEKHALKMAESIGGICRALRLPYIFKASYDKANRTSIKSYRGPGVAEGLRILHKVAARVKIPVLARAAVAAGVDGIFLEVHDDPLQAMSDGANALDLSKLRGVLEQLLAVGKAVTSQDS